MAFASIPLVTEDDLKSFHTHHFPAESNDHPSLVPSYSVGGQAVDDVTIAEEAYDGDGLGYYDDGVKRTLTDEQIRIFRHSEVQGLLRERRRREVSLEPGQTSNEDTSNEPAIEQPADINPSGRGFSRRQDGQNDGYDAALDHNKETDRSKQFPTNDIAESKPVNSPAMPPSQKKDKQSQPRPPAPPQYRRRLVSYED